MCHWSARITTTTISAEGRRARRITAAERAALTQAIARLKVATLPKFKGTCPIAYDGQELHYRFRGKPEVRTCKQDLRRVRAVQLVDRLIASLARSLSRRITAKRLEGLLRRSPSNRRPPRATSCASRRLHRPVALAVTLNREGSDADDAGDRSPRPSPRGGPSWCRPTSPELREAGSRRSESASRRGCRANAGQRP